MVQKVQRVVVAASPQYSGCFSWKRPDVTCFVAASYVVGCIEVGDFSTPLRSARNDIGEFG